MGPLRSDIFTQSRLAQMEAGAARRERLQAVDLETARVVKGKVSSVADLPKPPEPIKTDFSWVEIRQAESRQRIQAFLDQNANSGFSAPPAPFMQPAIAAYQATSVRTQGQDAHSST